MPDPERVLREVTLYQELVRPRRGPQFEWRDGVWRLRFRRIVLKG